MESLSEFLIDIFQYSQISKVTWLNNLFSNLKQHNRYHITLEQRKRDSRVWNFLMRLCPIVPLSFAKDALSWARPRDHSPRPVHGKKYALLLLHTTHQEFKRFLKLSSTVLVFLFDALCMLYGINVLLLLWIGWETQEAISTIKKLDFSYDFSCHTVIQECF